jgi:hypothetical protein
VAGAGEPTWTPEDRDKAKAYELSQREACPRCGTREDDWTDDEGELHDPPLIEPVVHRCEGCAETARLKAAIAAQARREGGEGPGAQDAIDRELAGHFVALMPFDPHRGIVRDREEE